MRKLLVFSVIYAITTICAGFVTNTDALVVFCAGFAVLAFILSFFRKGVRAVDFMRIFLLAFACAVLSFFLHEDQIARPCRESDGSIQTVSVKVTDYPEQGEGYWRVYGRLQSEVLPNIRLILYENETSAPAASENGLVSELPVEDRLAAYGNFHLMDAAPGDILSAEVKLRSSDRRYGQAYDGYYASGIFLIATVQSGLERISEDCSIINEIRYAPIRIAHRISDAVDELFGAQLAPFMKSLLLNSKEEFYIDPALSVSFSRAGIMHIVAVSGMHISFLVGFIQIVFGKKRGASFVSVFIIWFFVLMTGAVPSAVRAGFMQTMLLIAPLLKRESDPPTSLLFALLILLIRNPYAVKSVSLQLSFAAVAGIILFSGPVNSFFSEKLNRGLFSSLLRYIIGIFSASAGVMVFTLPLTAWHFGSVSVLSVLTNILVIWAVSLCFGLGFFAALFRLFLPAAGELLAAPAACLARYILNAAAFVSSIPASTLYVSNADNSALYWMIFSYLVFLLFRLFKKMPEKLKILIPSMLSIVALFFTVSVTKLFYQAMPIFSAVDVGQGQCLTVFAEESTVVVDCGSIFSDENAGERAGKYLLSCGRDKVNTLLISHLHEDHVNGIPALLEYIPVDEIILSSEFASDEDYLPEIKEAAKKHSTRITYFTSDTSADVGSIHISLYAPFPSDAKSQNEKCMTCVLSVDHFDMLVTADAPAEVEQRLVGEKKLPSIDILIIGHHGSATSSSEELLQLCSDATGIISVGYNTYGHPSEITLENTEKNLKSIYRTDRDGTVQLILDNGDMFTCLKNRMKDVISNRR